MMAHRQKTFGLAAAVIVATWLLAWGGFVIARNARATADRVRAYMESVDLARLSGEARARALREAADRINALPPEERRRARLEQLGREWFEKMTEEERAGFIEATMPGGFKQMLAAFEELPQERRQRSVQDALRRLKQAQEEIASENPDEWRERWGTNAPPVLSEDLQKQVAKIGLKTFYSESSARTKAELAPVMEELQRAMENGRFLQRPHP
jgi:uncharacterized membrane protein